MKTYRFCPICRSNLIKIEEDNTYRLICEKCNWRYYDNPLPSVAAVVFNKKNEILLIKRGVEPGKGKWALPSGFIEQNELPEQTVLRELAEETGINGKLKNLIGVYIEPTKIYGSILLLGYEIEALSDKPRAGSDTMDARFFPENKLPVIPFASHRSIIKKGLAKSQSFFIEVLKSKITEAVITDTILYYKGSMGIDGKIMKAANIMPGEKVYVLNYNNGERLETYTIEEKPGSGKIILYGPASLKGKIGDKLCILSYALVSIQEAKNLKPKTIILNNKNRIR